MKGTACDPKGKWCGNYTERTEEPHFKYHSALVPLPSAEPHYNFIIWDECKLSYPVVPVLQSCFLWGRSGYEEVKHEEAQIPRLLNSKGKIACYMDYMGNPDWEHADNECFTRWISQVISLLNMWKKYISIFPLRLLAQLLFLWICVIPDFPAMPVWKGHRGPKPYTHPGFEKFFCYFLQ